MKKTFTILIAAIAAIIMMAQPMKAWAQDPTASFTVTGLSSVPSSFTSTPTGFTMSVAANGGTTPAQNGGSLRLYANNQMTIASTNGTTKIKSVTFNMKINASSKKYPGISAPSGSFSPAASSVTTSTNTITWTASGDGVTTITFTFPQHSNGVGGNWTFSAVSLTYEGGGTPTPSLSVSPSSVAFGDNNTINPQDAYSKTFSVTFANLTENLTVSVPSGLSTAGVYVNPTSISKTSNSPQTVTVYFNPEDEVTLSGNITVSNTADNLSETVAVSGSSYDPATAVYYGLIDESQTDWSGKYIFAGYNSTGKKWQAFTTMHNSNYANVEDVTVSNNNSIASNTTINNTAINNYALTILYTRTVDNVKRYTIQMTDGKYLQYTSTATGNNLYVTQSFEEKTCEWTISYASSTLTITNVNNTYRCLKYNASSPRFACYTSGQVAPSLFIYQGDVVLPLSLPFVTLEAGDQTITPTWSPVDNADHYALQWSTSATFASDVHDVASTTSGTAITGLTNGTTYYVRVKAIGDGENYDNSDWSEIVWETPHAMSSVTITFKGNYQGATSDYTQTVTSGVASNLEENKFTRDDFAFNGWTTESNGSGVAYYDGESITITEDLTLYAQWVQLYTATVANNIANGMVGIEDGSGISVSLSVPAGTEITLTNTPYSGYIFSEWNVYWMNGENPEPVTVTNNKFNMPAHNVIVSATFTEPSSESWVLTPLANLTPADVFVIVGTPNSGTNYYSVSNNSNPPAASSIEITNDQGVYKLSSEPATTVQWNISGNATDGYTFYPVGSPTTWLNCNTTADKSSNNNIVIGNSESNVTRNIFELNNSNYLITKDTYTTRYMSVYSSEWRGYVNTGNNPAAMTFFRKVTTPVDETTPELSQYTSDNNGWHLIASPVASVTPTAQNGFLINNYDLYRFNQSAAAEWENHKVNNFNIVSGTGYLYANDEALSLTFTGQPYNGNGIVALSYDENARFAGYNLIGNPYNNTAYLADSRDFYRMNEAGSDVIINTAQGGGGNAIAAFEGILVIAADADDNNVIFQTTDPSLATSTGNSNSLLNITVSQAKNNRGKAVAVDAARIRFGEGNQLPKFQLFENSTKLYIPQGDKDYAVANGEAQGDMPLNFKTTEAGMYTISFEGDNMDLKGVCLIDMLAEEEIDLSVDPSYTFIGSPADKAERFKIVFRGFFDGASDDIFAFQSGSDIIVSGEGELQIFDVMGRKVKTQYVSGVQTVNVNAQGVYIMKLNEKTQKIIVR